MIIEINIIKNNLKYFISDQNKKKRKKAKQIKRNFKKKQILIVNQMMKLKKLKEKK